MGTKTTIEPLLLGRTKEWDETKWHEQLDARQDRLKAVFDECGADYENATSELAAEAKSLNEDIDRIRQELDPPKHPGFMEIPGSSSTKDGGPLSPGWKSGRWSEPFLRGVKTLTPSGSITVPSLTGGLVAAEKPTTLLQVIPSRPLLGTDQYSYLRETTRTHAAAPVVSDGTVLATKPYSSYDIEREDGRAETIAHLAGPIRRQMLDDANLLRGYLEGALREGLQLEVEDQVVNGNGTSPNLRGILNVVGIQTQAFSGNLLTTSRKSITLLENEYIGAGTFVLNPATWETIELLQEADGAYLLSGTGNPLPVDRAARRLWGRPVVVTPALASTSGLLVDFNYTELFEREGVTIDWSEQTYDSAAGASDFERNLLRVRAEGRWGFAVGRPRAVVKFATS